MTAKELLEKGYFPKELPPPFFTKDFADKIASIKKEWGKVLNHVKKISKADRQTFNEKFWESKWIIHSLPKVGYSRRLLGIPNPYHQTILTDTIEANFAKIQLVFDKSTLSYSKPVIDKKNKRAVITSNSFAEFKRARIVNSYDKLFEVKTDVSRYYGTIYTHIIPWILHTKAFAKANRKDFTLLGNILDKNLRESNSGQTLGIPVGPDTSLIVAEIIGCTLDAMVQEKFKSDSVRAFRFIDDYYIYCESQADAEKVFKFVQGLFADYQLDINEEKTKISKSPFPFDAIWAINLGSFTFRKTVATQQTDIERFISLAFDAAKDNPKDSVLSFAIVMLKSVALLDESWNVFQSVILKIAITEPATLPAVTEILIKNKSKVERNKVKNIAELLIQDHCPKGHHFEVSWALWLCKEFGIKLPNNLAELVFKSNDVASILVALDLRNSGLINSAVSIKEIEAEI